MADYIVRATAAGAAIRAFAITSRDLVETARQDHNTSPIMTAALGRLLSGGAMMGTMLKGEKDLLTLQIQCSGPARGLTVTADANGHVKGFVNNPIVELPPKQRRTFKCRGCAGSRYFERHQRYGTKRAICGTVSAADRRDCRRFNLLFCNFRADSVCGRIGRADEQKHTVRQAGGFIIQLMPFTSDEIIEKLEKRIAEIDSVTMMLERGLTPEGILEEILGDFGLEITDKIPAAFVCDCSKERVSRALSTLSKKDIDDIINDGESIEVKCQFCNKAYEFSVEELKELRK